jgi:hypothetical protein
MVTKLKNSLATNPAQSYLPNQVFSRAAFLRLAAGMGPALFGHQFAVAQTRDQGDAMQTRLIPSSGEALPVIGCGTYVGFDVGADTEKLKTLADVVRTLRNAGGKVFDSSPMYGRAEAVLGDLLAAAPDPERTFIATKVWTRGRQQASRRWRRCAITLTRCYQRNRESSSPGKSSAPGSVCVPSTHKGLPGSLAERPLG